MAFNLHLFVDLSPYLLSFLLNISHLMLAFLFQHCLLLPEEILLLILPVILHLDPKQLIRK